MYLSAIEHVCITHESQQRTNFEVSLTKLLFLDSSIHLRYNSHAIQDPFHIHFTRKRTALLLKQCVFVFPTTFSRDESSTSTEQLATPNLFLNTFNRLVINTSTSWKLRTCKLLPKLDRLIANGLHNLQVLHKLHFAWDESIKSVISIGFHRALVRIMFPYTVWFLTNDEVRSKTTKIESRNLRYTLYKMRNDDVKNFNETSK